MNQTLIDETKILIDSAYVAVERVKDPKDTLNRQLVGYPSARQLVSVAHAPPNLILLWNKRR